MDRAADPDESSASLLRAARSGDWWRLCASIARGCWDEATPCARREVLRLLRAFAAPVSVDAGLLAPADRGRLGSAAVLALAANAGLWSYGALLLQEDGQAGG